MNKNIEWDTIIVGSGFAGLSAAQYASRANLRTLVLESNAAGGQILLVDDLENYPGVPGPISGFEISDRMEQQARDFGANFKGGNVESVEKNSDGTYTVSTSREQFLSHTVIIASGAKHRQLGVPGEEEMIGKGVSYCATCDGPFFKKKKILVVGGGDAAFDEAVYLSKLSDEITIIHRSDKFRAQKAISARAIANEHITPRWFTIVKEIRGEKKVSSILLEDTKTGETFEENFDAIFIFVGSIPQSDFLPDSLKKDNAGHVRSDELMRTNLDGLFVAGDIRVSPFRQLIVAASDGAIAAHSVSQYIDELDA